MVTIVETEEQFNTAIAGVRFDGRFWCYLESCSIDWSLFCLKFSFWISVLETFSSFWGQRWGRSISTETFPQTYSKARFLFFIRFLMIESKMIILGHPSRCWLLRHLVRTMQNDRPKARVNEQRNGRQGCLPQGTFYSSFMISSNWGHLQGNTVWLSVF